MARRLDSLRLNRVHTCTDSHHSQRAQTAEDYVPDYRWHPLELRPGLWHVGVVVFGHHYGAYRFLLDCTGMATQAINWVLR